MSSDDVGSVAWPVLFRGPERVGWRFSDRTAQRQAFGEKRPVWDGEPMRPAGTVVPAALLPLACGFLGGVTPQVLDDSDSLHRQLERVQLDARGRSDDARLISRVTFALILVGGVLWWLVASVYAWFHHGSASSFWITMLWAAGLAVLTAVVVGKAWLGLVRWLTSVVSSSWRLSYQRHEQQAREWDARREQFENNETSRLASISDWITARLPRSVTRVSVVGDNTYGCEALLTVMCASILASGGSTTVLDLTGDIVVGELVEGAREAGYRVAFRLLPTELADVDLLAGMADKQVVQLLVEARHGGQEKADLGVRGVDEGLLTTTIAVLSPGGLSMGRIAAALRVAMHARARDTDETLLSLAERSALRRAFSDEYRRQVLANLRDLEAMANPLSAMGTGDVSPLEGQLRVLSMSSEWTSAKTDFLSDLLVGWAAQQVIDNPLAVPTLVVTAADRLAARHLDRLSDLCERRGVRLVAMFRKFEETTARMTGRGEIAFMRLNDPQQATRAADYIGREYKFTVSQTCTTVGGQDTHSIANNVSYTDSSGETRGRGTNHSRTRGDNSGASWNSKVPKTSNTSRTKGWSESDTRSWNRTRSWGTTVSDATTKSWSDSETRQRVHEHRVDPEVIKNLPDYAMLLVESTSDGSPKSIRLVELNPEIAMLDADPAGRRDAIKATEMWSPG